MQAIEGQRAQGRERTDQPDHAGRRPFLDPQRNGGLSPNAAPFRPESFNPVIPISIENGFTGTTQMGMMNGEKYNERPLYDDKSAERPEFQFDGVHKGPDWKSIMETFLVYKCPLMLDILSWAERHGDLKVTNTNLGMALGELPVFDWGRQEFMQ